MSKPEKYTNLFAVANITGLLCTLLLKLYQTSNKKYEQQNCIIYSVKIKYSSLDDTLYWLPILTKHNENKNYDVAPEYFNSHWESNVECQHSFCYL